MAEQIAQKITSQDNAASTPSEDASRPDSRLIPGGAHGSAADVGMSGMDRKDVPSGAVKPDQLNAQDSPNGVV